MLFRESRNSISIFHDTSDKFFHSLEVLYGGEIGGVRWQLQLQGEQVQIR
jgi:hypothetical protein